MENKCSKKQQSLSEARTHELAVDRARNKREDVGKPKAKKRAVSNILTCNK
jgi:hypothetical protein